MTADIALARGNNNSPIMAPVYDAPIEAGWDAIPTYDVVNKVVNTASTKSILSRIGVTAETEDVNGWVVLMVSKIGEDVMHDVVTLKGEKQHSYVVDINGTEYAVKKSIVRFVHYKGTEVTQ